MTAAANIINMRSSMGWFGIRHPMEEAIFHRLAIPLVVHRLPGKNMGIKSII